MANIIITGGHGNLAKELAKTNTDSNRRLHFPGREQLNVSDYASTALYLGGKGPSIVIHAAALTRPMNQHEQHPYNSIENNILGTANVALCCIKFDIKLVYISTDYVYPGTTGMYKETDPVLPVNNYGLSKYGGECSAQMVPQHLILRCGFVETPFPHRYAFTDVYKSSLTIEEAAKRIWNLIWMQEVGIFNIGGIRRTIISFAKETRPDVLPMSKEAVREKIAVDCSMDTTKYDKAVSRI